MDQKPYESISPPSFAAPIFLIMSWIFICTETLLSETTIFGINYQRYSSYNSDIQSICHYSNTPHLSIHQSSSRNEWRFRMVLFSIGCVAADSSKIYCCYDSYRYDRVGSVGACRWFPHPLSECWKQRFLHLYRRSTVRTTQCAKSHFGYLFVYLRCRTRTLVFCDGQSWYAWINHTWSLTTRPWMSDVLI